MLLARDSLVWQDGSLFLGKAVYTALSIAAQCIVIDPVCGGRTGGRRAGGVCYHDNSKLRASIFTKLGLWVQVVTISRWSNFGGPAPPGRGSAAGETFWLCLTTSIVYGGPRRAHSVCVSLGAFFFYVRRTACFYTTKANMSLREVYY